MAEEIIDGGGTGFNADGTPIETPVVPPVIVPPSSSKDDDMVAKLVQARIDAQLKPIKDKLDNAFKARDEAMAKVAAFEATQREAELKKLEEEGKHREAYELRLAQRDQELEVLRKKNTELSRDVSVKDALKGYQFKNDKAATMAFGEIVGNLVQNDQGVWVHRSGISVSDYCEVFSKEEEQSFLFKSKPNSGGGGNANNASLPPTNNGKKSVFAMTQAEILALGAKGPIKLS